MASLQTRISALITAIGADIKALQAPAGARATRATNQTITTSTWTAVLLTGETWDTATLHDNTTNNSRITVPSAGKYICEASAIFAANATGARYVSFAINGSRVLQLPVNPAQGVTNFTRSLGDILNLAANDYVELHVYQDSGGNLDILAASLAVVKL